MHLCICASMHPSFVHLGMYASLHLFIYLSIYLSVNLSIHLSIHLSICLSIFRVNPGRAKRGRRVKKRTREVSTKSIVLVSSQNARQWVKTPGKSKRSSRAPKTTRRHPETPQNDQTKSWRWITFHLICQWQLYRFGIQIDMIWGLCVKAEPWHHCCLNAQEGEALYINICIYTRW